MSVSSDSQSKKLSDRLLQLSIDIEDRVRAIGVLNDAISEERRRGKTQEKEIEATYSNSFEKNVANHKLEISQILASCSAKLKEKEDLTIEVENLLQKKKEEEKITRSRLNDINKEIKEAIENDLKQWDIGKKERQERWVNEETQKVRDSTIKALEPQVKSLLNINKVEEKKIKTEFETRKKFAQEEIEREYHNKMREYERNIEKLNDDISKKEKAHWNQTMTNTNANHLYQMMKLKERMNIESEAQARQQADDLKKLDERHSINIMELKHELARELQKVETEILEERDEVTKTAKIRMDAVNVDDEELRKRWEYDVARKDLQEKYEEELRTSKKNILDKRNKEIDSIIRYTQEKEVNAESVFALKIEENRKLSTKNHDEKVQVITKQIAKWKSDFNITISRVKHIREENERINKALGDEEGRLKTIECSISEYQDLIRREEASIADKIRHIISEKSKSLKEHQEKKSRASTQLSELKEKIEKVWPEKHKRKVEAVLKKHKEVLDELEMNVMNSVKSIDDRQNVVEQKIRDERIRLERLQYLILNYKTSRSEGKIDIEEKRFQNIKNHTRQ